MARLIVDDSTLPGEVLLDLGVLIELPRHEEPRSFRHGELRPLQFRKHVKVSTSADGTSTLIHIHTFVEGKYRDILHGLLGKVVFDRVRQMANPVLKTLASPYNGRIPLTQTELFYIVEQIQQYCDKTKSAASQLAAAS